MDSNQGSFQPTTPTPISTMRVRSAPGVQLSTTQIELLVKAFPDSQTIFVKREFRSGYSGALVLLVALGAERAPVVVKLSHPDDLQREYQAYQQFVRQISPQNIAHLLGEPLLSADGQMGLIEYSFAGGESQQPATSLRDYYESNGGDACAAVLNRIFRAFGRYWWANNRPQLYTLGEQYDRLLPVHLQVAKSQLEGAPSALLENGKTSGLAVRPIEVGQSVRLLGFQVSKVATDGRKVTLMAYPPPNEASAPLRVRLEFAEIVDPLQYKRGDVVGVIDVLVVATRSTLLRDVATAALPSFDPDTKAFTADLGRSRDGVANISLVNPLYDLSGLLDTVLETKTSVIHGDLNLQNVLVDPPTGFAWIIDFGETRHGPTLLDLQRLEVQVITKLLPPQWSNAQLDLAELVELLSSLHSDSLPPSPSHLALQEPYRVWITIRRLARQYLIDDLNWDEYYLGLAIALVGALKYEELDSLAHRLALVAAATVQGLVGSHLTIGHAPSPVPGLTINSAAAAKESTPPQAMPSAVVVDRMPSAVADNRRYLRTGVGIILALVALLVVWQWWPASSPPLNPEAAQTPSAVEAQSTSGATLDPESQSNTPNRGALTVVDSQTPEPPQTNAPSPTVAPAAIETPFVTPANTPLPVQAAPNELLLIVAQFSNFATDANYNVAGRIDDALTEQVSAAHLADTRVAEWPETIRDLAGAVLVLQETGATLVIWGEYDSGRVRVRTTVAGGGEELAWQRLLVTPTELSTTINLDVPRETQALALMALGRVYRKSGDLERARSAFSQALAQEPSDEDTVATLSFYLAVLNAATIPPELDQAIEGYSRVIEMRPQWFNARYNRGLAYLLRYWQTAETANLNRAIDDFTWTLGVKSDYSDAYLNRGTAYFARNGDGDLDSSLDDFTSVIHYTPASYSAYYNRGLAYIRLDKEENWIADLQKSLQIAPTYWEAYHALCWGYALAMKPQDGLASCEQATLHDNSGATRDGDGLIMAELGRLEEATTDLEQYLAWLDTQPEASSKLNNRPVYEDILEGLKVGENRVTPQLLVQLR